MSTPLLPPVPVTQPANSSTVMMGANALLQTYRAISVIEHAHEHGTALDPHLPGIRQVASSLRLIGSTLLRSTPDAPAQAIQNAQEELKRIGADPRTLISECLWAVLNAVHLLPTVPNAGADLLVFLGFAVDRLSGLEAEQQVPAPGRFRFRPLAPTDRLLFQTLYACACSVLPPLTEHNAAPGAQTWTELCLLWQNAKTTLPNSAVLNLTPSQQRQVQSIRRHLSSRTTPALAAVELCRHLNDADWKKDPLVQFWNDAVIQIIDALRDQAPPSTTFKFFPGMGGGPE